MIVIIPTGRFKLSKTKDMALQQVGELITKFSLTEEELKEYWR